MKIAIIGLGLIGGSFALELKKNHEIFGIDSNKKHQEQALQLNLVDKIIDIEKIHKMDAILIAIPVDKTATILKKVLDLILENTVVFDVGSTKEIICNAVKNHPKRKNFIAMHPIAGTEHSGPKAAIKNLFKNKVNIICEKQYSCEVLHKKVLKIIEPLQMRTVYIPSAKMHDKHIAYVSHLSHISAFMLGKTVLEIEKEEKNIFDMAGSGFESTVRLAKSSPKTWTPIFMQNKKYILQSLDEYIQNLKTFRQYIQNQEENNIYKIMEKSNNIKKILNGKFKNN